jgi:FkbM family methyltransferase
MSVKKKIKTLFTMSWGWAFRYVWKHAKIFLAYWLSIAVFKKYWVTDVSGMPIKMGFVSAKQHQIAKKIHYKGHEHEIVEWWAAESKKHKVIYDFGGYNGLFGIASAMANPNARVSIFEPDPECSRQIEENIKLNGVTNCELKKVAISDKDGISHFSDSGPSAHIAESGQEVKTVKLDSLPQADLIKLDVEGIELKALKGGAKVLKAKPMILLEDHHKFLPRYGDTEEELFKYVDQLGYKRKYLREDQYSKHFLLTA